MKRVAILGAGPAGLMAAYAASLLPNTFVSIFAQGGEGGPTKSVIGGAQFIHEAVPGLHEKNEPDMEVKYLTVGSPVAYKEKVYGSASVPFVSMSNVVDGAVVPAWSMQKTYDKLWSMLIVPERVNIVEITPMWLIELIESGAFDVIISTIPKTAVCLSHAGLSEGRAHMFVSQSIRTMARSAFDGLNNTIIYDGSRNVSWYRTSSINGVGATEWGASAPAKLPYYDDITTLTKPIRTDCQCFDGSVIFAGRHGEWRKGALVHDAFKVAFKALAPERAS